MRGTRAAVRCSALALLAAGLVGLATPGAPGQEMTQARSKVGDLDDREKVIHLLNRCAFGPRPGDIERVLEEGWEKWVERQLEPAKLPDGEAERRTRGLKSLDMSCRGLMDAYWQEPKDDSPRERRRVRMLQRVPGQELQAGVLLRAVYSERQLFEVMCEFWRNHFNVDLAKDQVRYLAPAYERDVVRKHCFGKFEDMLMASAKHACMLIYLDNVLSQKPLSESERKALERAGDNKSYRLRRLERERGLNENYARELLELHTLGVDNGYDQRDVIELARVLTGWTVERGREASWEFRYRDEWHDKDPKRVLSWRFGKDGGVEEGEEVIRRLARHKGTATFIATKLLRYLHRDVPPEDYVERVAKVFLKSGGDLREVYRAIIFDPQFFDAEAWRRKFKTPFEYAVSMMRAVDADVKDPDAITVALRTMRQPIYNCEDPTGYYDTAEAWLDPGVLALRWQYALDLAERPTSAIRIPARFFGRAPSGVALEKWLAEQIVPAGIDFQTQRVLDRHVAEGRGNRGRLQQRLTGLLLGSPEFQRQ